MHTKLGTIGVLACLAAVVSIANPVDAYAVTTESVDVYRLPTCTEASPLKTTDQLGIVWTAALPGIETSGGVQSRECRLNLGDDNAAVLALQASLMKCNGAPNDPVDGVFGKATEDRVKFLQKKLGLTVDGIYGPATRQTMSWLFQSNETVPRTICALDH